MKQNQINTIVFDIGNVLVDFRWKEYLDDCGYDSEAAYKISSASVNNKLWKEWDRSLISEEEIIDRCCEQEPSVEKEIRKLFNEFHLLIKEHEYAVDLIKGLKENGYKVYLLSNYSRTNFEKGMKSFQFYPYVDGGVISYEIHYIKPEAEIYDALIKKYDINPMNAVFLDDLQDNLDGAKLFGFHTIRVESYEQMVKELKI